MNTISIIQPVYAQSPISLNQAYGFGNVSNLGSFLSSLLDPMFEVAATAVVFFLILGALRWIASGGHKEAIASARQSITTAIIGFVLLMMLFLVLQFITRYFDINLSIIGLPL